MKRVEYLRTCIDAGLDIGHNSFLDEVDIVLADNGIADYDSSGLTDDYSVSEEEVDDCPFVQFYDNGFAAQTEDGCDFMLELAKIEMYSQLGDVLTTTPPTDTDTGNTEPDGEADENDTNDEEAAFW